MNCRIDWVVLVGVVLDGVVAGVREGIGMIRYLLSLPFFWAHTSLEGER